MSREAARWVSGAAAACVLLSLAAWLAPIRLPSPPVAAGTVGVDLHALRVPTDRIDPGDYRQIVEANPLSPTREPPPADRVSSASAEAAPEVSAPRSLRRFRLVGLVRGPDGIVALIDADERVPGAELYRVGDRVGPYRLAEASDSVVVLRGPDGEQVLRLDPTSGRLP